MTDILNQGLQQRQAKVKTAKEYLARTRQLFNEFGSDQLKTTLSHFNGLADALNADEVRLVVLGEFSRGKSSLVNALLGINLLPTAMEATTAINTFIRALPAGRTDRHIKVHYQNGTPDQEIPWLDDKALVSWGTELDAGHADVRKTLDYIEVFMDHPLLQKGLVLIDTPGLESVMEHHEMITRRAIAESHIALWVQNTTQLGGSASEWDFLEETLRTNFSKFITVVGWWDKVLEPEDSQDQQKSETQREEEKLERIRANFRKHLSDAREIASLTGPEHLIPVSAKWAMTTDPEKQRRSNVNRLAERITNMFTSGEAMEQIYSKPLQQMTHIQNQLSATLADELQQLASDKTQDDRQRELERLDQDILLMEQQSYIVAQESEGEHNRAAQALLEQIQRELVIPLSELKADIENQVNESYIRQMMEKRVKNIGLPETLEAQYREVTEQLGESWKKQKQTLTEVLEGLRTDYAQQMENHVGELRGELSQLDVEIPSLKVGFNLDFSLLEQHHRMAMTLEQNIENKRRELERTEEIIDKNSAYNETLLIAKQEVERAANMLKQLGGMPPVETRTKSKKISDGGTYSDAKYTSVPYTDNSSQLAWKEQQDKYLTIQSQKEARLAEIVEEEERKTTIRLSNEKALKKYEKELSDMERKMAEQQKKAQNDQSLYIQTTTQQLIKNTAGQLDQRIRYLENHVAESVHNVFNHQLDALKACVAEQYIEPLNAKRAQRAEIQALLQKSEAEITQRKEQLQRGKKDVEELLAMTQVALQR